MLYALHYDCIQERSSDLKLKGMPSNGKVLERSLMESFRRVHWLRLKVMGKTMNNLSVLQLLRDKKKGYILGRIL